MENMIELLTNYGIGIVCVAYLIYFQHTTMREMLNTLSSINDRLLVIETYIHTKEQEEKTTKKSKKKEAE